MRRLAMTILAVGLGGCGGAEPDEKAAGVPLDGAIAAVSVTGLEPVPRPTLPEPVLMTRPLALDTDLTVETVAAATCTRGHSFAKLDIAPDGEATGQLTDTGDAVTGEMIASDAKTVVLRIDTGTRTGDSVTESMQITTDGQRVMLTGATFVCRAVAVWAAS